ncbi:tRNA (guanosine(46)-N7)-methyltransferase TrmB [Actinomyces mediterranea]|uniref:tRNA (guanosine(46)-N7)-methyltransferase TrmB n=1 Tax=Actinomyces mediterranea TaxID=1871028 RepID=UPI000970F8C8|nr:tRNA (guanosine(46)-N7)-methyltransferase TrmB [Actinomyces mediterranea]
MMADRPSRKCVGTSAEGVYYARTKSFIRRSRELPANLQRTWERHGADYVVEVERGIGRTTVADSVRLDVSALFGRAAPLTVEIGSGTGEQIVHSAAVHPDRDYLAFEVWVPGIAKLISKAVAAGVGNVRVIEVDAQQAFPVVFDEAVADEVWTFFPDPWRKARHHKRRLVAPPFALDVARVLADGGVWRLATDWDDYAWQMRDTIEDCDVLANPYEGERPDPQDPQPDRGGFAPRFAGRIITHFETRGIDAGRRAHDIVGVRLPRAEHGADGESRSVR